MMYRFAKRAVPLLLVVAMQFAPVRIHGQGQDLQGLLSGAQAAQQAGDYARAAEYFKRATTLSPNTAELWSNRGVMEYLAGHVESSTASLKHALRLKPDLFAPLLFLGKAYVETGKPSEALPYLARARSLHPDDPETLLTLGKADTQLGRPREAAVIYAEATRAAPENAAAWLGLGAASLQLIAVDGQALTASSPKSVWARALYADELLTQSRPVEATEVYETTIASATLAQRAGLERTLALTKANPDQFPLPANTHAVIDRLLVELNAKPGADASTVQCSPAAEAQTGAEKKSAAGFDLEAAACAYWAGDYERSAVESARALQQMPQNAEALYWAIKANERLAVGALSRVDELAPNSATSHVLVGDLYRNQRQPDGAIVEYQKALALDAHEPAALLGLAASYFAADRLEDATATAKIALADRPSDPQLNLLMAEILGAKGQEKDAKPYLARCADIAPEFRPRVHYLLGRAENAEGNLPGAIHEFELALPGDQDGKTHYQLSRLYRRTGDVAKAQQAEAEAKALVARRDAKAATVIREVNGANP